MTSVAEDTASITRTKLFSAYVAWAATAVFYCYQYILRVSPGVMVTDLRQEFKMTAEEFSSMGAIYLYAYSLLQIPIGLLIDKIGIRKTVIGSVALCVAGTMVLLSANTLAMVQFSRLLVGAGSACAFISALKIAADFLPPGSRGLLMGATLTLGTVGALTASKPLVYVIESYGWRQSVIATGLLGIAILFFALIFLRLQQPKQTGAINLANVAKSIFQIIKNQPVMIYALLAIGLYTPLSVLADLWGTAFLMQKFDLSRADAAQTSMMMYVGLSIGSLLLPWICEKWGILNETIKICGMGILIIFAYILFGPNLSIFSITLLLILLGIFCGAEMICFTGAVHYTHSGNSGLTIGVVNTLNMLGGALLQQGIGFLLDRRWNGDVDAHGVRLYQDQDFVVALSLLLMVIVGCVLISFKLDRRAIKIDQN
jgi:MFS family permease